MTLRRSLTAVLAAAMLLTACTDADQPDTTGTSETDTTVTTDEQPSDEPTDEPAGTADDNAGAHAGDGTDDDTAAAEGHTNAAAADTDAATAETGRDTDDTNPAADGDDAADRAATPAAVTLTFDGRRVPVATACNGVDGAVLATTEGEVTITLVQEEGTALRYQGEGMTAETDQVEVEQVGASTVYRATLESAEVPAVDVELALGDTSVLADC